MKVKGRFIVCLDILLNIVFIVISIFALLLLINSNKSELPKSQETCEFGIETEFTTNGEKYYICKKEKGE
ncbi:MAG: hypothetical protein RR708_05070 [Bacilli bacterium]